MLEQVIYLDLAGAGVGIIQSRIIELSEKKQMLEYDINYYADKLKKDYPDHVIDGIRSKLSVSKKRLQSCIDLLSFNKELIGFDDSHNYQLEN